MSKCRVLARVYLCVCAYVYGKLLSGKHSFQSWTKQSRKSFLGDWFTNLDGKGERGATEMFLHRISNPLCCTKQISHFLGTQVTETLHRPQGTNKDI